MRPIGGLATALAALLLGATPVALAGTAVVISRDMLALVTDPTSSCPPDRVVFVTRDAKVVAVCDMPPAPDPVAAATPLPLASDVASPAPLGSSAVPQAFAAAPVPTWRMEEGASIRETLSGWLPADWTLAWDTSSAPLANAPFEFQGDAMAAIADLFDRRSIWPDAPLTACSFPKQRILQIRATGECGAP